MFKKRIVQFLLIFALIMLFLNPKVSLAGARNGLLLWFNIVLPTLFPYIVLTNLISSINLTRIISKITYPILKRVLGVSKAGCFPVIGGCLCGYPVGASIIGSSIRNSQMSHTEGRYLLIFCNNASPLFMISFVGYQTLSLGKWSYLLPVIVILCSFISARTCYRKDFGIRECLSNEDLTINKTAQKGLFAILDSVIFDSMSILVKVGGYIIIFSLAAAFLAQLSFIPDVYRTTFIGMLEVTTGMNFIYYLPIAAYKKAALATCLCTFGGLSSAFQTKSVLHGTRLTLKSYIFCKLLAAGMAYGIASLLFRFLLG